MSAEGTTTTDGDAGGEALLRTEGLTKKFGELVAVDRMDLTIERDSIAAVIGPNGAGKSTLFNLVCGLHRPTEGRIFFKGTDITGKSPHEVTRLGIGRSFQIVDIFEGLSIRENLRLAVQFHHDKRGAKWRHADSLVEPIERTDAILDDLGLEADPDERADTLSHGDRRKLDVALTIATDPDLILLDEPTAGLGNEASVEMVTMIKELVEARDITMVLVEHDLEVVFGIADVINVMHNGALLARGSADEIQRNTDVQRAYLGTST